MSPKHKAFVLLVLTAIAAVQAGNSKETKAANMRGQRRSLQAPIYYPPVYLADGTVIIPPPATASNLPRDPSAPIYMNYDASFPYWFYWYYMQPAVYQQAMAAQQQAWRTAQAASAASGVQQPVRASTQDGDVVRPTVVEPATVSATPPPTVTVTPTTKLGGITETAARTTTTTTATVTAKAPKTVAAEEPLVPLFQTENTSANKMDSTTTTPTPKATTTTVTGSVRTTSTAGDTTSTTKPKAQVAAAPSTATPAPTTTTPAPTTTPLTSVPLTDQEIAPGVRVAPGFSGTGPGAGVGIGGVGIDGPGPNGGRGFGGVGYGAPGYGTGGGYGTPGYGTPGVVIP